MLATGRSADVSLEVIYLTVNDVCYDVFVASHFIKRTVWLPGSTGLPVLAISRHARYV